MNDNRVLVPFVFWGGSPKRILHHSSEVTENECLEIMRLDSHVRDNSPQYIDLVQAGINGWVDVPYEKKDCRLFVSSSIVKEMRPTWYFLCLLIGKQEWRTIATHSRLLKLIGNAFPSGWSNETAYENDKIELCCSETIVASECDVRVTRALGNLEQRVDMTSDSDFRHLKIFCNPLMVAKNGRCAITEEKSSPRKPPKEATPEFAKPSINKAFPRLSTTTVLSILFFLIAVVACFLLANHSNITPAPSLGMLQNLLLSL